MPHRAGRRTERTSSARPGTSRRRPRRGAVASAAPRRSRRFPTATHEARASTASTARLAVRRPRRARRGPAPEGRPGLHCVVASRTVTGRVPAEFARALEDLHGARLRPEVRVTEVPAPQRIAPYAVALTAEVVDRRDDDDELGLRPVRPAARPGRPRAVGRRVARGHLRPRRARARAGQRPDARRGRLDLADRGPRATAASATPPRPAPSPAWSPRASAAWPTGRPASRWRSARRGRRSGRDVGDAPAGLGRPAVHDRRAAPAARGRRRPARAAALTLSARATVPGHRPAEDRRDDTGPRAAPGARCTSPADGVPDVVDDERALAEAAARHRRRRRARRHRRRARLGLPLRPARLPRAAAPRGLPAPGSSTRSPAPTSRPSPRRSASAEWVLHAATQDLPCLAEVGLRPTPLFDTELGGRLLGLPRVGLAAVVEHYLGLSLAKEHSAVDWSTRPLPEPWLRYAALDVEVLVELRDAVGADLAEQGKAAWARQEFDARCSPGPRRAGRSVAPHLRHAHPPQAPRASPWSASLGGPRRHRPRARRLPRPGPARRRARRVAKAAPQPRPSCRAATVRSRATSASGWPRSAAPRSPRPSCRRSRCAPTVRRRPGPGPSDPVGRRPAGAPGPP